MPPKKRAKVKSTFQQGVTSQLRREKKGAKIARKRKPTKRK